MAAKVHQFPAKARWVQVGQDQRFNSPIRFAIGEAAGFSGFYPTSRHNLYGDFAGSATGWSHAGTCPFMSCI